MSRALRDARQRRYERRISIYFMANIAGAQECNNEDEEGRSDSESDREDQAAFHNLKVLKKLLHQLNKYIQHFLECHGRSVETNALSTTVDHIAAVAINTTV